MRPSELSCARDARTSILLDEMTQDIPWVELLILTYTARALQFSWLWQLLNISSSHWKAQDGGLDFDKFLYSLWLFKAANIATTAANPKTKDISKSAAEKAAYALTIAAIAQRIVAIEYDMWFILLQWFNLNEYRCRELDVDLFLSDSFCEA